MTDEEIKALQDERDAALAAKAASDAAELKAKGDLQTVVKELQDVRAAKIEAERKANLKEGEPDIESIIDNALKSRDQASREQSFKEALEEFKRSKPEFQADPAGLVYAKFEDGLKRFNFADIASKEQMKSRLSEVYQFLNFQPTQETTTEYDGTPSGVQPVPGAREDQPKVVKSVLEMTGMEDAKYKELKGKYPEAFENLGM